MKEDRKQIMLRTSWISVIGNAVLSGLKIVIGLLSGSLAVLSDGLDSASDVLTSLIILVATPIINRPPNNKYVYGQEKAEHIASTILSFVIFFMGCQMFYASATKIYRNDVTEIPSMLAIWVTVISIVGKLLLAWYQFHQGKRTASSMLKANAINMRNDVIISVGVLIGLGCTFLLKIPILDPILALIISIYIVCSAIGIFKDANLALMDGVSDVSVYKEIIKAAEEVPGVRNPHRIRSAKIGNMYNIVLDIEANGNLSLKEAHDLAHKVEQSIKNNIDNVYDIVVHVEPLGDNHCHEKFGVDKSTLSLPE